MTEATQKNNGRRSNWHSHKIVDTVQNMIDDIDDLDTSIRQIGGLLVNIDWLVRNIVKEQGAHESRLEHELVAPQLPRFESPRLFSVVQGREGCQ